jgi:hypothetical protein
MRGERERGGVDLGEGVDHDPEAAWRADREVAGRDGAGRRDGARLLIRRPGARRTGAIRVGSMVARPGRAVDRGGDIGLLGREHPVGH